MSIIIITVPVLLFVGAVWLVVLRRPWYRSLKVMVADDHGLSSPAHPFEHGLVAGVRYMAAIIWHAGASAIEDLRFLISTDASDQIVRTMIRAADHQKRSEQPKASRRLPLLLAVCVLASLLATTFSLSLQRVRAGAIAKDLAEEQAVLRNEIAAIQAARHAENTTGEPIEIEARLDKSDNNQVRALRERYVAWRVEIGTELRTVRDGDCVSPRLARLAVGYWRDVSYQEYLAARKISLDWLVGYLELQINAYRDIVLLRDAWAAFRHNSTREELEYVTIFEALLSGRGVPISQRSLRICDSAASAIGKL